MIWPLTNSLDLIADTLLSSTKYLPTTGPLDMPFPHPETFLLPILLSPE